MKILFKRNKTAGASIPASLGAGEPCWINDKLYVGSVGTENGGVRDEGVPVEVGAQQDPDILYVTRTVPSGTSSLNLSSLLPDVGSWASYIRLLVSGDLTVNVDRWSDFQTYIDIVASADSRVSFVHSNLTFTSVEVPEASNVCAANATGFTLNVQASKSVEASLMVHEGSNSVLSAIWGYSAPMTKVTL